MMPEYIEVNIPGAGRVTAVLLEQYPDGDVRVLYKGRQYICKGE